MRRILTLLPIVIVAILGGFFYWGLSGDRDPSSIPSVLVSQPVPVFDLPPLEGVESPGLSQTDLQDAGELTLVNFFASWCGPCRAEHAVLTRMQREQGFRLVAINYKDKPEDAARWLKNLGNPYSAIGADVSGRAGIEWGISGVPETFIIDADGTVVHRFAGPIVGDGQRRFQEALDAAKVGS
ncbi:MAG: DsbE family thiol:disulfide interchange protein [Litoreibacter sp.]|nr:DsbE family thiol:disulfide interchange protein [Litoreibacter sp.]